MPIFMNACFALFLFTLITVSVSRPQEGSEPYFSLGDPQSEKTEDGKNNLVKTFQKEKSAVIYEAGKNDGDETVLPVKDEKIINNEIFKSSSTPVSIPEAAREYSEPASAKTTIPEATEKILATEELMKHESDVTTDGFKTKSETEGILGVKESISEGDTGKESFVEAKDSSLTSKPDGKDDVSDLGPDAPLDEEKRGEVFIGRFPLPPPLPLLTRSLPILIPFGGPVVDNSGLLSSFPPAVETTDRLPMPEADVLEASSETAVAEDIVPADKSPMETERFWDILRSMLALGLPPPLSMVLPEKSEMENATSKSENTKTVDLLGRKFILKTKMANLQPNENGRIFIRFMAFRPLEMDPQLKKKTEIEKDATDVTTELDSIDAARFQQDESFSKERKVSGSEDSRPDVLKTEETRAYEHAQASSGSSEVNIQKQLAVSEKAPGVADTSRAIFSAEESSTTSSAVMQDDKNVGKDAMKEFNSEGETVMKSKDLIGKDGTSDNIQVTTLTTLKENEKKGKISSSLGTVKIELVSPSSSYSAEIGGVEKTTRAIKEKVTTGKEYNVTPADLMFEER